MELTDEITSIIINSLNCRTDDWSEEEKRAYAQDALHRWLQPSGDESFEKRCERMKRVLVSVREDHAWDAFLDSQPRPSFVEAIADFEHHNFLFADSVYSIFEERYDLPDDEAYTGDGEILFSPQAKSDLETLFIDTERAFSPEFLDFWKTISKLFSEQLKDELDDEPFPHNKNQIWPFTTHRNNFNQPHKPNKHIAYRVYYRVDTEGKAVQVLRFVCYIHDYFYSNEL